MGGTTFCPEWFPQAAALGFQVRLECFLEAVGSAWMGWFWGWARGAGRRSECRAEPSDPVSSPAVLTEDGQPCRFPFRYGGRMFHSCTSEGNADRKWWVRGTQQLDRHHRCKPGPTEHHAHTQTLMNE